MRMLRYYNITILIKQSYNIMILIYLYAGQCRPPQSNCEGGQAGHQLQNPSRLKVKTAPRHLWHKYSTWYSLKNVERKQRNVSEANTDMV